MPVVIYGPVTAPPPPTLRPLPLGQGGYNGLYWGPGRAIQVVDHKGVEETPPMRTNQVDRAQQDGAWAGRDFYGARTLQLKLAVLGLSNDDLRAQLYRIERDWLPDSTERQLWLYDYNRYLNARIRSRVFQHAVGGRERVSYCVLDWYCRDPFYHSMPQQQGVTAAGATLINAGSVASPISFTIQGPATNPRLSNGGLTLLFNVTLGGGDLLSVDTDLHSVLLNGAPRSDLLDATSRWWTLLPGDNVVGYASDSAGSGELAVVTYTSAWP